MTDAALHEDVGTGTIAVRPSLDRAFDPRTIIIFLGLLGAGLLFVAYSLYADVDASGARTTTFLPYLLLFVALLIALGFEFVNGFHDTANAVATVIYTHSLPARCPRKSPSCGRDASISSAFCCRAGPSHSASSRCCRLS
jgi:PiT family inorganic phosphate transporter